VLQQPQLVGRVGAAFGGEAFLGFERRRVLGDAEYTDDAGLRTED